MRSSPIANATGLIKGSTGIGTSLVAVHPLNSTQFFPWSEPPKQLTASVFIIRNWIQLPASRLAASPIRVRGRKIQNHIPVEPVTRLPVWMDSEHSGTIISLKVSSV
jgi:hypothetical protein